MPSLIPWTFPRSPACCKRLKNFPRKTWLKALNREQKSLARRYPTVLIKGQSASRNQTMQMKMILEGLIPGVEHGDDAKGCLKTGLAKLKECLTNCFKKKS